MRVDHLTLPAFPATLALMKEIWAAGIMFATALPLSGQTCSDCKNYPDLGAPVDDACTRVVVSFGTNLNGDCSRRSLNPALCLPDSVCLFTVTIEAQSKPGCPYSPSYTAEFCTEPVDQNGRSLGSGTACATATPMAAGTPSTISNWAVPCGRKDFLRLHRQPGNELIGSPGGACAACVDVPDPTGGE